MIDLTIGLRLDEEHELIGADVIEHGIGGPASGTDLAAESVISLTSLAENAMAEEFKVKVNHLLKDFFRSICRHVDVCETFYVRLVGWCMIHKLDPYIMYLVYQSSSTTSYTYDMNGTKCFVKHKVITNHI